MTASRSSDLTRRMTEWVVTLLEAEREGIDPEALPLLDELVALVGAGGKRLRPLFCYWGYRAGGGEEGEEIYRACAALEVLHTFALIYDDFMDASPTRRHRPATFASWGGRPEVPFALAASVGASAAILAGLLGFVLADRMFYGSGFPPDRLERAARRYDAMRLAAIAGQFLDIMAPLKEDWTVEEALRIADLKSGRYTVADPLVIGALLAGAGEDVVRSLEEYGRPLGTAFQIRDDVLGTFGDPRATGKDRDGDLREGKHTVLVATALELASPEDARTLRTLLGDRTLGAADAERLRTIIAGCGALHRTNALADELTERARSALPSAPIDPGVAAALEELAYLAVRRQA